ncbi:oxygen-independent coproporphyrinogen III oxidase [Sediminicoccus sp. KRV36]|uniref:oxygen-independent coproporphyrinogen III oxidase n=1 Tax=Sediminicoccus sp. KRV36 TaxID=3133721 RepID=UPI00200EA744|nr:oxygen-independent coproporphyrinogen III oxidase [Sediminicoccus rosea]UPY34987.1 oxygen-independent coproporphyrinogen III oxidase [Sediminicoccus rosea]
METLTRPARTPPVSLTANLPRYTSYPTAPHFGPMEEGLYRSWLGRMPAGAALSLYAHIPFCHELCWYCGCHTSVTRNEARIARYAAALEREAETLARALPADGLVQQLHLGGGTPSALGGARLTRLMGRLRALFPFAPEAELSVELDPRTLTQDAVDALATAGFTRASLGLQDANAEVQARMGRIQPEAMLREAVDRLRRTGIRSINLDMMYGLPGQTAAHVRATARLAAELGAERVAVFGYAHVPWMKPSQKAIRVEELPAAQDRLEQAEAATQALRTAGYLSIGLDHFARPQDSMARACADGKLRRNFQGYTTDQANYLLGLGASSIGATPEGYAQNLPDERGYVAAVEAGRLPIARGLTLTAEDIARRAAIERVMCDLALDLDALAPGILATARPGLEVLEAQGLVRLSGAWLTVPEEARPFLRHVAACFDAYLGAGKGRHSVAV